MWPNLVNTANFPLSKGGRIKGVPLYELEVKYKNKLFIWTTFLFFPLTPISPSSVNF